jgi:hypothetical protein
VLKLLFATVPTADHFQQFDKVVPVDTLRTETALPPQHGGTQRLFGGIVRRLDVVFAHECPDQMAHRRSVATRRHIKEGGDRCHHGSQPAPFAGCFPAGFVDVAAVSCRAAIGSAS